MGRALLDWRPSTAETDYAYCEKGDEIIFIIEPSADTHGWAWVAVLRRKCGWFPPEFAGDAEEYVGDVHRAISSHESAQHAQCVSLHPGDEVIIVPSPESGYWVYGIVNRKHLGWCPRCCLQQVVPQPRPLWLPRQLSQLPPQQLLPQPAVRVAFPCIMSDSTLLNYSEPNVVLRGAGSVCGKYGGSFTGAPSLKQAAMHVLAAWRAFAPDQRLPRVGFVPADVPYHQYTSTHSPPQDQWMHRVEAIPTDTLETFDKRCYSQLGVRMFRSKGVHLTIPGRDFLETELFKWMLNFQIDLVICGGWNALRAEAEYEAQASFIKELYSVHDEDSGMLQ